MIRNVYFLCEVPVRLILSDFSEFQLSMTDFPKYTET
jgi:hypothetical protein